MTTLPKTGRNAVHATFVVERVYAASPARVFSAFADPEKGSRGQALSGNQAIKLKEIVRKAKGEKKPMKRGKGFGRSSRTSVTTSQDDD